jgi:N-ethylmaleimide reductase
MSVPSTSGARSGADPQTPAARLFQPIRLGRCDLPHRIVMAPLTRSRFRQPGNVSLRIVAARRLLSGLTSSTAPS